MRISLIVLAVISGSLLNAQNVRLRFMDYNLMYYRASSAPCTHTLTPSQRDQELKKVVKYVNPDVFVVNELGSNSANAGFIRDFILNTDGVTRYATANYSNNSFSGLVNMLFYDKDQLALYDQTSVDQDLSGNDLVRIIDLYTLYYRDPQLNSGADTVFFTVVAAHLKAGNSSADATYRAKAINALMNYLDQEHDVENIVLTGDLNVYRSTEAAYTYMTNYSVSDERLYDPLNMPGSWNNNSAFASIHTQSTHSTSSGCFSSSGMDDRFDHFLLSEEIMNGEEGVSYVQNSYVAVGQDGNHYNTSINNGGNSAVPSSIADALYNFSDHLPITLQLDIELSDIGITEDQMMSAWVSNPVDQEIFIKLMQPAQGNIKAEIYTSAGKLIKAPVSLSGYDEFRLNVQDLRNGLYLLKLTNANGGSTTRKFIKQ